MVGGSGTPETTSQPPDVSSATTAAPTTETTTTVPPETTGDGTGLPPEPPPSGPVTVGGGGAAGGLVADPRCDPTDPARTLVTLTWSPSGSGEQRVVVSTRQDGLDSASASASGPLSADSSSYQLRDSQSGGVYYWRVLTRAGDGWSASDTVEFTGASCALF